MPPTYANIAPTLATAPTLIRQRHILGTIAPGTLQYHQPEAPGSTRAGRRIHTCSLELTVASMTNVKLAFCGPTATV